MQTRRLGDTDLHLSVIGLGTWAIGGPGWKFGWGPQSAKESLATIRQALEVGINWIDTAPLYGLGLAEEMVGKALAPVQEKPIIATKCGRFGDRDGRVWSRISAESIRAEIDQSFQRLKVDVIDLYQIHWPQPEEDIEEAWEAVAGLVEAGKIRYAGVSNFNREQLQRIQPIRSVDSLQNPYSMIERGIEDSLLSYCAANRIGVLAYSPLQKGLLSARFTAESVESLPPDDHRCGDRHFQRPALDAHLALANGLRPIAEGGRRTPGQLAVAWLLRRQEVTAAIVGARRAQQIADMAVAGRLVLSDDELSAIDRLLEDHAARTRPSKISEGTSP
jgi:aryl-alcohol dehydrogenase-like predicted oxidoreductase